MGDRSAPIVCSPRISRCVMCIDYRLEGSAGGAAPRRIWISSSAAQIDSIFNEPRCPSQCSSYPPLNNVTAHGSTDPHKYKWPVSGGSIDRGRGLRRKILRERSLGLARKKRRPEIEWQIARGNCRDSPPRKSGDRAMCARVFWFTAKDSHPSNANVGVSSWRRRVPDPNSIRSSVSSSIKLVLILGKSKSRLQGS